MNYSGLASCQLKYQSAQHEHLLILIFVLAQAHCHPPPSLMVFFIEHSLNARNQVWNSINALLKEFRIKGTKHQQQHDNIESWHKKDDDSAVCISFLRIFSWKSTVSTIMTSKDQIPVWSGTHHYCTFSFFWIGLQGRSPFLFPATIQLTWHFQGQAFSFYHILPSGRFRNVFHVTYAPTPFNNAS